MGSILYGLATKQRREASVVIVTVIVFVGWVISVCLHEFGHAIVAYWGGDKTVKDKGYLTLNPLKYTDVSLSLVLPIIFLLLGGIPLPGGAVYINHSLLRNRGWESAMSAAGPAMTLLVAVLLSMPFRWGALPHFQSLSLTTQDQVWLAIAFLALLEVAGVILNLLPIPSLDGFGIIEPWLPPPVQQHFRKYSRYGFLALFALLWFVPAANVAFWNVVDLLSQQLGIPTELARFGHTVFQQWSWLPLIVLIVTLNIARRLHPQSQRQVTSDQQLMAPQSNETKN
jgi:Zn-dependent protease